MEKEEGRNNTDKYVTTIKQGDNVVTLINVFVVPNREAQKELIRLLEDATEQVMRHIPGFVSANIHQSLDGTHVVNYAQWESKDAFEAMLRNKEAKRHMAQAYSLSRPEPHLYKVASTYHK